MRAATCAGVAVFVVLAGAAPSRADVTQFDGGWATGAYTQGPGPTFEADTITDLQWQGTWWVEGAQWRGTLHGRNGSSDLESHVHVELLGYSASGVRLEGTCDSPPRTGSALPSPDEPYASLHCSMTLRSAVPRHMEVSVRRTSVTSDISTSEWKRYHEIMTATPVVGLG